MGRNRKKPERHKKKWTQEEENYLREYWGSKSLAVLSRHLKRSEKAVSVRAQFLHLGAAKDNNLDYITLNNLITILYNCASNGHSYLLAVRLPRILKVYKIPMPVKPLKCIKISEFWEYAEKNRSYFDFSKLKKFALGPEPGWVAQQRKLDSRTNALIKPSHTPWTPQEDSYLRFLASRKRYTCNELSAIFRRTEGSVMRRLTDLGLYKSIKHNSDKVYSQSELDEIGSYIIEGYSYPLLAEHFERSEKSLRGMIYVRFGSENLTNARNLLLSGSRLMEKPKKGSKKRKHTSN